MKIAKRGWIIFDPCFGRIKVKRFFEDLMKPWQLPDQILANNVINEDLMLELYGSELTKVIFILKIDSFGQINRIL